MKTWYGIYAYIKDIRTCAYEGPDWNEAAKIRDRLKDEWVQRVVVETWTKTVTSDESVNYGNEWSYVPSS